MENSPIELKVSSDDDEVAYLYLPDHPRDSKGKKVAKQLEVRDLIDGYSGPDLYLDFDDSGTLIGIEILA